MNDRPIPSPLVSERNETGSAQPSPALSEHSADDARALAAMPAQSPLEMPVQPLSRLPSGPAHVAHTGAGDAWVGIARCFTFGGALALTIYGAMEMYAVVELGGVTALEWTLLVLFVINFSWISLALTSAVVGLAALMRPKPAPVARDKRLTTRTAVVLPTFNENPARVFGALVAMIENVGATSAADAFDWLVLSDTTDPDIWVAEERALVEARRRLGSRSRIYYRHRPRNTARKAGNIADFVTGWGGAYDHMLVLDADSVMAADAIVTLAAAMEADPDAGIIQSLPLIINRNTMFARLQQFAARIYGPIIAHGLATWSGRDGNYWGHNAIIRTSAFAAACGLPALPGRAPFGGHILSHDFVEAALIRRAGWSVYMLPHLTGSYEESPPSLVDLAIRDRRWCQGNLQHTLILPTRGFKLVSRQHLASGIMSYLASPVWMGQLLVGIALVLQSHYIRPEYFTDEFALLPAWPRFDAERALWLFGVTMAVLLMPKLFGLVLNLFDGPTRRGAGGGVRLVISSLIEIVLSALLAPIMMVIQTGAVLRILMGRDSGWNPQRRDDGSVPFVSILRRHFPHMLLGFVTLVAGFLIAPSLVVWMSPTIAGLLLAALLSWGTAQLAAGLALRRWRILLTPEETSPPPIVAQARKTSVEINNALTGPSDCLRTLHADPGLRALHSRILPPPEPRRPGDIDPFTAVAIAKLGEARSIDDAVLWLQQKERLAVLNNRALLERLAALPAAGNT